MYRFISHVAVDIFIHTYLRFRLFAVEPQLYYYKLSFKFCFFVPVNIGIVIIRVVAVSYHQFNITKTKLDMKLDYIPTRIQIIGFIGRYLSDDYLILGFCILHLLHVPTFQNNILSFNFYCCIVHFDNTCVLITNKCTSLLHI